jgi:hypothetical protein
MAGEHWWLVEWMRASAFPTLHLCGQGPILGDLLITTCRFVLAGQSSSKDPVTSLLRARRPVRVS